MSEIAEIINDSDWQISFSGMARGTKFTTGSLYLKTGYVLYGNLTSKRRSAQISPPRVSSAVDDLTLVFFLLHKTFFFLFMGCLLAGQLSY